MTDSKFIPVLLSIITVFVVGAILLELRTVLLPFSVALLLSFIFQPIVIYLKKKKIPTIVTLVIVLLSLATVLFLAGLVVYSSALSFTEEFGRYGDRINAIVSGVESTLEDIAGSLGMEDAGELNLGQFFEASAVTSVVSVGVGSFLNFLSNALLVILFMLFILAGSGELDAKIKQAFPAETAERIIGVTENISQQVRQYLAAKTLVSALTGFLLFLVLWILGVDFPIFWGFLAFLFNFVPNIGSFAAVVLPFGVSLLQFPTLGIPLLALALMFLVQTVVGNVVDPRLMAFSLNLSPLLVLVSLIFWGWLWGIVGMILAVPLTATIKIFFSNLEPLRPVAILMGGSTNSAKAQEAE